jgi:hypothetical protein
VPAEPVRYDECRVAVPAALQGALEHLLRQEAEVLAVTYGESAVFRYRVKASENAALAERIARATSRDIRPEALAATIVYE